MDCGPTCLKMITRYYGVSFRSQTLRELCEINRGGTSILGISKAAEKIGMESFGGNLDLEQIKNAGSPFILHWELTHFVVLFKVKRNRYYIADPAQGVFVLSEEDFKQKWLNKKDYGKGMALLLKPTSLFYEQKNEKETGITWSFLFSYLKQHKRSVIKLFLCIGLGSLLPLLLPIFTQSIVDVGINKKDLKFVYIILIAQAVLIISRTTVDFFRSWILLNISTRINISIVTDFLVKLMNLPISFFDVKMSGDIMQRINDQKRIETFLTGSALITVFSTLTLTLFSCALAYYNYFIFLVFFSSSLLYVVWASFFLKRRRLLDYKNFDLSSKNQSTVMQVIFGMQDIKLNNGEQQKVLEWEAIQQKLFKFKLDGLNLNQYQQGGSTFINETKNLVITFLSAKAVIEGHLTLGEMTAVQYIIGQLNSPIDQLMGFIQGFQDTKISLERLNEIYEIDDEEPSDKRIIHELPANKNLKVTDLTFKYTGYGNLPVLEDVNIDIPQGKITAIVGMSGSGKTTLLKLLLRFYKLDKGEIRIGDNMLDEISFKTWRDQCGVVMQEGFIFSDTISNNITIGHSIPDNNRLNNAIQIANLQDFINDLPLRAETKIGAEGNGISQGQRQRILIARAVYKDPEYIFFDEATNSLDANNESIIMNNLKEFFKNRTVVIVAHRLSTVSSSDNIVLLENGRVKEQGTHQQLIELQGEYFRLVKNQLALDN